MTARPTLAASIAALEEEIVRVKAHLEWLETRRRELLEEIR